MNFHRSRQTATYQQEDGETDDKGKNGGKNSNGS
jgi:hypothetical protein